MNEENSSIYIFESFRIDPVRRRLSRDGQPVPIHSKTFDLLLALIENRGRVIEKSELMEIVWANQIVEEGNLTVKMSALRKTLGERKDEARFIVTVPGKGYRFVADVRQAEAAEDDGFVIERHAVTHITVEEETETDTEDSASGTSEASANGHLSGQNAVSTMTAVGSLPRTPHAFPASEAKSKIRLRHTVVAAALVAVLAAFGYLFSSSQNSKNAAVPLGFQQAAFKRLTTSGKIAGAAVSPDGNYFVFAQREAEGQSLWVRQIAESRRIEIIPAGAREYWGLTFTPDGTHIYATVFTPNKAELDLIRVPTLGGAIERLPTLLTGAVSFSPDGKRFAYINPNSPAGVVLLRVANADGSDDKILAEIKYPSYFVSQGKTLAWSPDGAVIACATKLVDERGDYGTVMVVRVHDGSMFSMLERPFPWVESVSWLGQGGGLVITANETAATPMQLWHLAYPGGAVERLSNDLNSYSWASATSDGKRLLAVNRTTLSSLWVASYEGGEIGTPQQIASEIVNYGEIGWTSEGKIVYRSAASGAFNLWRMDGDGANPGQLTTDAMPDKGLAVSPDNRYIVFSSYRAGKYNLWRAEKDGANPVQLTDGAGEVYPRITPDSRWVIYQQGTGQTKCTIWRLPIEGGAPEQITRTHTVFPALAPDGSHVAYFYMDATQSKRRWRIGVARTADGALTHSFDLPENISGRVARWTPDGAALVYARSNGETGSLWRQPLDGSPPIQVTRFDGEPIENFAWSQDGKRFAFTRSTSVSDVTLIENFR
jgi:DNA-binding winged helix-turn-helix (wHTH) protein/Tol biopolymer transport system component